MALLDSGVTLPTRSPAPASPRLRPWGRPRFDLGVCVGDEPVEPVAEDLRVGIEQDDGAALAQAEGAVDRADEAEVAFVLDEVEQAAAGEPGEVCGEFRVGERSLTASRVKGVAWGWDRQA